MEYFCTRKIPVRKLLMDTYRPLIGTPVGNLDTPLFVVDMDSLEHNFRVVAEAYKNSSCKMREHAKNIKTPFLARMQIKAGGTVGGVCCAKVSEAEAMFIGGITDILIPNQIVSEDKIIRLCGLARQGDIKVCVDNSKNVRDISDISVREGVIIGVLIEINTGMNRAGIRTIEEGVELARLISELPGIEFRGVMSHQHLNGFPTKDERYLEGGKMVQICLDVKKAIEDEGILVEIVSSGETWSYDLARDIGGVTEVEGGTYALMGTSARHMSMFRYAGKVLASVISTPRPGVAIGDVGTRGLAVVGGLIPDVDGLSGVAVDDVTPEHIILKSEGEMPLEIGDKFMLTPGYQDGLVNQWDRFIGIRNGVVEGVWDIPGRGCFH